MCVCVCVCVCVISASAQVARKLLEANIPQEAIQYGQRALSITHSGGRRSLEIDSHHILGDCYMLMGSEEKAAAAYERWRLLAKAQQLVGESWNVHLRLAYACLDRAKEYDDVATAGGCSRREAKELAAKAGRHVEEALVVVLLLVWKRYIVLLRSPSLSLSLSLSADSHQLPCSHGEGDEDGV